MPKLNDLIENEMRTEHDRQFADRKVTLMLITLYFILALGLLLLVRDRINY